MLNRIFLNLCRLMGRIRRSVSFQREQVESKNRVGFRDGRELFSAINLSSAQEFHRDGVSAFGVLRSSDIATSNALSISRKRGWVQVSAGAVSPRNCATVITIRFKPGECRATRLSNVNSSSLR